MPFFQVDDQLAANPKAKQLAERALTGDVQGVAALGLWTLAGSMSQASLTDGVVTKADTIRLLLNPQLAEQLAQLLVQEGLWHTRGHACPRCPPVEPDQWLFHDWFDLGYDRADQIKNTRRRRRELKDRNIVDAVWARDCLDPAQPNQAACRYCGKTVNRYDRKTEDAPNLEHVDPAQARGVRNLVVACGPCNRKKGRRTPAQAGMTLRPAPRPSADDPLASPTQRPADTAPQARQRPVENAPAPAVERPADTAPQARQRPADTAPVAEQRPVENAPAPAVERPAANAPVEGDQDPVENQISNQTQRHLIPGVHVRTRASAPARAGWAGSGQGQGGGPGEGSGQGEAQGVQQGAARVTPDAKPRHRSRGRRRSRRATSPATSTRAQPEVTSQVWDAGEASAADTPGQFGSPWHGWTGPASEVTDTDCPVHDLPLPCRRCGSRSDQELTP